MRELPAAAPPRQPDRLVYSVSTLTRRVRDLMESEMPQVWVEGEISNLSRPASGHVYFSLKDERCQIRCALFRGRSRHVMAELVDGARVLVRARLTLYEARGDTQLVVQEVEDAGEGALRRAFEALKRRLQDEGLFDERHKKPLPDLPVRVGVITSPTGAAVRDIVATFRRRFPAIPLLIYPVSVQGAQAVDDICAMLRSAGQHRACDVLILARGGGSLEDLQAFNDERVARAVFDCPVPVVCGVGHESDITICDFVADRRATTPTAAAELISPSAAEWLATVTQTQRRVIRAMRGRLEQHSQRVDWLSRMIVHPRQQLRARGDRLRHASGRLASTMRARLQRRRLHLMPLPARLSQASPAQRLAALRAEVVRLEERLQRDMGAALGDRRQRLERAVAGLNSTNPLAVLARGYALVSEPASGAIVKSVTQVERGDHVDVQVSDGRLACTVKTRQPDRG